ncbi:MAG: type I DNA topoisomerase [Candidatus Paceibacterota bacterium]|jgi:DNA topoisomerase-1
MKLIIVESPTKAKTISSFLKGDFRVLSSYGHVRDLPKSKLSIDVEHNFEPHYIIPPKAKEHVAALTAAADAAEEVILASDEDREGEAIAWHIAHILGNPEKGKKAKNATTKTVYAKPMQRIVFHEITKTAINEALAHPRQIDLRLVDAQQARRVLDRLVGYELSPFLWRKIRYGLSAGRVQSVALRLVVEREREIQKFTAQEYWSIDGIFHNAKNAKTFSAHLATYASKHMGKMAVQTERDAHAIVAALEHTAWHVETITTKEISRAPAPPFTTSTLQQEAARKLGFSAKQTMGVAQQLYENGLITYMRTDSVHMASSATAQASQVIAQQFGPSYALDAPRYYATHSKGAQEAHEAIRPTDFSRPAAAISFKDRGHQRLYELIWKRALACQMQAARLQQTAVDVASPEKEHIFRANGQVILFDGFMRVYMEGSDGGPEDDDGLLPPLAQGDAITATTITPAQHFTEPPARYTDATLIKALESYGVGRPSTYAPTLSTIQDRGYVEKIDKKYVPTEIGCVVTDMLVEHFPEIVDINFTSHIEEELDQIAEGNIPWTQVCKEFYVPFKEHLNQKEASVDKHIEISTTLCPHCGKPMIIKFGRMGKFLACPDPENKFTMPLPEEAAKIKELEEKTKDELCPLCGAAMKVKRGRFGFFLGCSRYPTCKGIAKIWNKIGFTCPACLASPERMDKPGDLVERKGRGRSKPFWGCTRYPDCTFILNVKPTTREELDVLFKEWKEKVANGKKTRKTAGTKKIKPASKKK